MEGEKIGIGIGTDAKRHNILRPPSELEQEVAEPAGEGQEMQEPEEDDLCRAYL